MLNKMRPVVVLLALIVVGASFLQVGAQPSSAQIGKFVRLGMTGTLTEEDVTEAGDSLLVDGPALAQVIKVDAQFLKETLGSWSMDEAFSVDSAGRVVVQSEDAEFARFVLSQSAAFTFGSDDSVRLLERPMWLSASMVEGAIQLEFDDGDTSGQQIQISRNWLWDSGIDWPHIVHEDGSALPVTLAEDGDAFIVDVPHFSLITINPSGLDVKGRVNGIVVQHQGERRWYQEDNRLEVDVSSSLANYELLVEKGWVDQFIGTTNMNISHPWSIISLSTTEYYSFSVPASSGAVTVAIAVPLAEILQPFLAALLNVGIGDVNYFSVFSGLALPNPVGTSAGGPCPFDIPDSPLADPIYLGSKSHQWQGDTSLSNYDRQVDACYGTTSDGTTTWAYIFWKLYKNNQGGDYHLTHKSDDDDPCDTDTHGRAYCVRVQNVGDPVESTFKEWAPAQSHATCTNVGSFSLSYGGFGFEFPVDICSTPIELQAKSSTEARWAVQRKNDDTTHKLMTYEFGVTQRVPVAAGDFNGKIELNLVTRFHCQSGYYSFASICVIGSEVWDLESNKLSGTQAFTMPQMALGDQLYTYSEAAAIVAAGDSDAAVALATTLLGAKLLMHHGQVPSAAAMAAMADADELLSGYGEKLPWQTSAATPEAAASMDSVRATLNSEFVTQVRTTP